jgi:hypothetical protein
VSSVDSGFGGASVSFEACIGGAAVPRSMQPLLRADGAHLLIENVR